MFLLTQVVFLLSASLNIHFTQESFQALFFWLIVVKK